MKIVKNSINIFGIEHLDKMPNILNYHIYQFTDIETIFIPQDKPDINNIFEIMIDIEIKSKKIVNTDVSKKVIINGIKNYKVFYLDNLTKENIIYINTPYNTLIEISKETKVDICNIFIIDAYFSILSSRKIYSHLLLYIC